VQSARTRQKEWSAMLEAANREAGDAKVAFSELSHRFERLDSERSILDAESVDISTRRNAVMLRRETVEQDVRTTVEAVQTASAAVHSVQVKRHEEEKARDEAMALESAARVEVARLRGENERLRSEFARRRDASERTRDEATRLQNESQADASRSQQLAADASALDTSIVELSERRIVLADRLVEIKRLGAAQAEASEEAMRRERERTAILEEVQAQLGSARLHEQRASMQCEEIIDRAREEAHISIPDLADTLTLTEHFQVEYADQKIQELKIKLERLGSVSSDATVELDSIETRFADLDRQRSDLEVAKRTLQETIRELDTQCGIRFRESFDSIRKHFGELFRRLFRGGKADILLQEGVDPLESGVEILAQPPGKKLQTISLLSGGERSLTALALLFAAFKTKPSPFCVLDEVDAALDDANVERFLGMLDEFKSSTQFIVVTHHRRTMSVCSALLGVTMPEHGVSQKVAVRLEDVDRIVPGAVGSVTSGARLDAGRPPAISVEL
ncbi:MAG: AAA family ATPase, partial [Planctomycetota bacterium]